MQGRVPSCTLPAWFGTATENFDQVLGDGVTATGTTRVHLQRPVVVGKK